MSAAFSLLPTTDRARPALDRGPRTALDIVHDHVLRIVGDRSTAQRLVLDVVLRANARAEETGESTTLALLLRLARARVARLAPDHLDAATLRTLAPSGDPAARALSGALAAPSERAAALLDLTIRHGMDTATAASCLGLDARQAAAVRADALERVRTALAAVGGQRIDVTATLATLPVVPAPSSLHDRLVASTARQVPSRLAWLAPPVAVAGLVGALLVGLPNALAGAVDGDVPLVVAEAVTDAVGVQQLRADGDTPVVAEDEVVVRETRPTTADEPAAEDEAPIGEPTEAPTAAPSDEPTDEPDAPADELSEEPEPAPSDEPSDDPLDTLLPTGP